MSNVIKHPSANRIGSKAAERYLQWQKAHRQMVERTWLGILVSEFTDTELAALARYGYFSLNDRRMLKRAGRPIP